MVDDDYTIKENVSVNEKAIEFNNHDNNDQDDSDDNDGNGQQQPLQ